MSNFKLLLNHVKAFAFDVDGVFTDGQVYLFPGEEFVRAVNIKDGYAVQHCIKMGFPVAIISGGRSNEVALRFQKLGVTDIYLGASSKLELYEDFRMKHHLEHSNILFMGDDIPDYEIMQKAGVPTCPADAAHEIKEASIYISDKGGGKGCVRDVIEQVLRLHKKWMDNNAFEW
ncbi:MAG: 3-deoxy-D-manno-octulosonate 8-phosphate phosphatase [Bacteroidales bacterium]|jgi:3-deoxy-D-manno-octulosonate 8-phosphate phosphatase (KDO 8-P phosphatase)